MNLTERKKTVLLICDMVGHSRVGMGAMLPVFSYLGFPTFSLPTALVSNTFNYGDFSILDTTDYIRRTLPVWNRLGFSCDAICTGYIYSAEQARLVSKFCQASAMCGTKVFVDPVMGDRGKLYNGISEQQIMALRQMVSIADVAYPNYTEACILTDTPYQEESMTAAEAHDLLQRLRQMGCKSVLITSCRVDGRHAVVGYDHAADRFLDLTYEEIPGQFHGTGDLFAAVLTAKLLEDHTLEQSAQKAMDVVYNAILRNKQCTDKLEGISIENHLDLL